MDGRSRRPVALEASLLLLLAWSEDALAVLEAKPRGFSVIAPHPSLHKSIIMSQGGRLAGGGGLPCEENLMASTRKASNYAPR